MKKIKSSDGSMTLEACIVLPIFIFLLIFIYGFMLLFTGRQVISHALLQSSQSLSLDSYATDKIGEGTIKKIKHMGSELFPSSNEDFSSDDKWYATSGSDDFQKEIKSRFTAYMCNGSKNKDWANTFLHMVGIEEKIDELDFSGSSIDDATGDLKIVVRFTQKYVFDFNGLGTIDTKLTVLSHMW